MMHQPRRIIPRSKPQRPLRRDLSSMIGDGAAFSLMVGAGETFVPAFVLVLGLGEVTAGLIATLPMLAGAVLQLASPWAVARLGSHRRWVVACALCQAVSLLLLPLCTLLDGRSRWLLYSAVTLYWAAGLATGPAWNTWVETLVPRHIRTRFFALRTRVCQAGVLVGFVLAGSFRQTPLAADRPAMVFSLLFIAAAVGRFVSAWFLSRQGEPERRDGSAAVWEHTGIVPVLSRLRGHAGAKLLAYLLAMQASVWIAAPFFTPYMIAQLRFSYWQFVLLVVIAFVARILVMPLLAEFAKRFGTNRLLWLGGIGIVPLSALWLVSSAVPYLCAVQFIGGTVWAAHELAMFLMFFETIPRRERTSLLTLYNVGNALAMVAGSLVGALLLSWLGETAASYLWLFAVSSLLRACAVLLIIRVPRTEVPLVQPATRTLALRPSAGAIVTPVLPSLANGERSEMKHATPA